MKYIILGLGSVGSLWASLLYERGNTVYGVTRGEHYNKIKKEGLNFIRLDGSNTIIKENEKFRVFSKANNEEFGALLSDFKKDDCIIITTKAYSLRQIAEDTKELLDNAEYILLLQNGIGNEEIIKEMLPNLVVFRATTTMGAFRSSAGTIKHTGPGFTKLGFPKINYIRNSKDGSQEYIIPEKDVQKYKTKARVLADELGTIGYDVEYVDEIDTILWEKIFVNVGINAPASIYNIPNGDLLKDEKLKNLMRDAITEAWRVGKAMKIKLEDAPDKYIQLTFDVAQKTAPNINSMLQDIRNGKQTEIDFINGRIVKYGKELGIETPVNKFLTEEIKKLEKGNNVASAEDINN